MYKEPNTEVPRRFDGNPIPPPKPSPKPPSDVPPNKPLEPPPGR